MKNAQVGDAAEADSDRHVPGRDRCGSRAARRSTSTSTTSTSRATTRRRSTRSPATRVYFLNGDVDHAGRRSGEHDPRRRRPRRLPERHEGHARSTPTPDLWVQNAPSDTETIGLTYNLGSWNVGFFSKRVGQMYNDNGSAAPGDCRSIRSTSPTCSSTTRCADRRGCRQSRIRLAVNNLTDSHAITAVTPASAKSNAAAPGDILTLMAGRSVVGVVHGRRRPVAVGAMIRRPVASLLLAAVCAIAQAAVPVVQRAGIDPVRLHVRRALRPHARALSRPRPTSTRSVVQRARMVDGDRAALGPLDFVVAGRRPRQPRGRDRARARFRAPRCRGRSSPRLHRRADGRPTAAGRRAPLYVVPGNHEVSNAVGFYKPMRPLDRQDARWSRSTTG